MSAKSKSTPAKAVASKRLEPVRKNPVREKRGVQPALDPNKFLVEDGIRFPTEKAKKRSDRDVVDVGHDPETALVSDVMTRQTLYCYADQSALEVRDIMRLHGIKQLPVVDATMRIIGIVYRDAIEEITASKKK